MSMTPFSGTLPQPKVFEEFEALNLNLEKDETFNPPKL